MVQRLDGIYFNSNFDCEKMNSNIKRTYHNSQGVVFQTQFNKHLIFNWFGEHENYRVINNGSDVLATESIQPYIFDFAKEFDNIWSCAAGWHNFKRLKQNIQYFLDFSEPNDCLIVAGTDPDYVIEHPRVFYVGNIEVSQLLGVFKASKYFIHLAYLDHCPNVVIDARACGAKIICSSSGGTKEIAGTDAIIIEDHDWDFSFIKSQNLPKLDFDKKISNNFNSDISMVKCSKKYLSFLKEVAKNV
jgi:glycosyltransferase involved in cell wall biosynthesis